MFGKKHLIERQETYWTHFKFAFKYGAILLWAATTSFIHGLVPSLFPYHSANTVIDIYKVIQKRDRDGERDEV